MGTEFRASVLSPVLLSPPPRRPGGPRLKLPVRAGVETFIVTVSHGGATVYVRYTIMSARLTHELLDEQSVNNRGTRKYYEKFP